MFTQKRGFVFNLLLLVISLFTVFVLTACGGNGGQPASGSGTETGKTNGSDSNGGEKITLSFGHLGAPGNVPDLIANDFAEEVAKRTDGRLEIELYGNAQLGGELEMAEQVNMGTLDLALLTTGVYSNFVPELGVMDLPFLFKDEAHARSIMDGEIGQELANKMVEAGFKPLAFLDYGFGQLATADQSVRTPEEMQGMQVRVLESEVNQATLAALGADVVPIAYPELYTSLQMGVVDGAILAIEPYERGKFYEVTDYFNLISVFYMGVALTINNDKFSALDEELQSTLTAITQEKVSEWRSNIVDQKSMESIQIIEEHGTEVVQLNESEQQAFAERVEPVYEQFSDKYGDLIDRIRNAQ